VEYIIYLSIVIVLLALGIVFILSRIILKKKHIEKKLEQARLEKEKIATKVAPELLDYIKKATEQSMPNDEIIKNLTDAGWERRDVDIALKAV
jgi:flagellar basal body-associated protein FliL